MKQWSERYAKHTALNLGQALQGIRYIHSHPDVDLVAPVGSLKHFALSVALRSRRVANDFFFAVIPPDWHHTPEELEAFCGVPFARWFQYGYCAWRFSDSGNLKSDLSNVDRRWDPRCKAR